MEKSVKENLESMNTKEKAAYIWEYHKVHICLFIFLAIVVSSLIYAIFINPAPKIYSGVAIYGDFVSDDKLLLLKNTLTETVVPENINKEVRFTRFYINELDPMVEIEMGQMFEAMLLSKELDLVIADNMYFDDLLKSGYIVGMDEILSDSEIKELAGNVLYTKNPMDEHDRPYGVSLAESKIIKDVPEIDPNTHFIGFFRISDRPEESAKVLSELLK